MFIWFTTAALTLVTCCYVIVLIARARWDKEVTNGRTALVNATHACDLATVKKLLSSGAPPDQPEYIYRPSQILPFCEPPKNMADFQIASRTPLMIAAQNGATDVAAELIAAGANVNYSNTIRGKVGNSVLGIAVGGGRLSVVQLLLANGADPNQETAMGSYPLIDASDLGDIDVIGSLIDAGANVNLQSSAGDTALITAAWVARPSEAVVRKLLDSGAIVTITNNEGKRAADIAAEAGHSRIARLIEDA